MDAKVKAGKLISKFVVLGFTLCSSRECALIAVDEIISCAIWKYNSIEHTNYWKEVKKEIEIL